MSVNPSEELTPTATQTGESATSLSLKQAARRLFAERGIKAVTVREIARAAGQSNQGAVAYHFGTKEALVLRILTDGAERIEDRRRSMLETMAASGGPSTVYEAVAAIVLPSAQFADEDRDYGSSFNLFLLQLNVSNPHFVDRALAGQWNEGYQVCLRHLRRLTPQHSRAEQNRRFLFLASYVSGLLAARDGKLLDGATHPTWRAPDTLDVIVHTASAIVEC